MFAHPQAREGTQSQAAPPRGFGVRSSFSLGASWECSENVVPPSESLQGISDQNTDDTAPMVVAFADIKDKAYEL